MKTQEQLIEEYKTTIKKQFEIMRQQEKEIKLLKNEIKRFESTSDF